MTWITPEIIAIVAVGVALAGLVIRRPHRLEDRLLAVEKEQARTSGLLKGLGITGRAAQTPNHGAD